MITGVVVVVPPVVVVTPRVEEYILCANTIRILSHYIFIIPHIIDMTKKDI